MYMYMYMYIYIRIRICIRICIRIHIYIYIYIYFHILLPHVIIVNNTILDLSTSKFYLNNKSVITFIYYV